jgi:hypothetical protein
MAERDFSELTQALKIKRNKGPKVRFTSRTPQSLFS